MKKQKCCHYTIVKAILRKDKRSGKILLLKSKWGYWDLPGGHLCFGETPEEGLAREIKEEVGVDVGIDGLYAIQTVILDRSHRKPAEIRHYSVLIFNCYFFCVDEKIRLSESEIVDWKWVDPKSKSSIVSRLLLSFSRDIVKNMNKKGAIKTKKKYYITEGKIEAYKKINLK